MSWLLSVYIAATVFGVGITVIDLLGLIGSHDGDGGDAIGDHEAGDGFDHGGEDFDHDVVVADHSGEDAAAEGSDAATADHGGEDGTSAHGSEPVRDATEHEGSLAGHDRTSPRGILLRLLSAVRNLIYFCLGFGPVGWFAVATGTGAVRSLVWSAPVGVVALVGTRLLRRFMRRELNSEVHESELLMEKGEVTVSIGRGEMGKVRIKLGELYVERFARAAQADATIHVGTHVRVTDVGDDCVYVEEE